MFYREFNIKSKNYRFKISLFKSEEIEGNLDEVFSPQRQKHFRKMLWTVLCRDNHRKKINDMDINEVVYHLLRYFKCFDYSKRHEGLNEKVNKFCEKYNIE